MSHRHLIIYLIALSLALLAQSASTPVRYVIKLKASARASDIKSIASRFNTVNPGTLGAASVGPATPPALVTKEFSPQVFNGLSGKFTPEFIDHLIETTDAVDIIEEDKYMSAAQFKLYSQKAPPSWGIRMVGQSPYTTSLPYYITEPAGRGVSVYVLDTGVKTTHPDFKGRAFNAANFVTDEAADDLNGHGTHVAGTIAGRVYGVAKNATIRAVKVLNADALGTYSQIIAGIQYVVQNAKPGRSIINFSISGPTSETVNAALQSAFDAGIAVIGAAGNDNHDACLNTPASAGAAVFAVGAVSEAQGKADFSNYGACVSAFAPGVDIQSLWNNGGYAYLSGTSQASPHTAGVAAIFMSMFNFTGKIPTLYKYLTTIGNKNKITGLPDTQSPNNIIYNGCDPRRLYWKRA